jgi:hypothetical protein
MNPALFTRIDSFWNLSMVASKRRFTSSGLLRSACKKTSVLLHPLTFSRDFISKGRTLALINELLRTHLNALWTAFETPQLRRRRAA